MILIKLFHILFVVSCLFAPIVEDCEFKLLMFILITFTLVHYILKHGKCGLINIERFFLGDDFKNGILYRLIKPIISYKNNIFYEKLMFLHIAIICVLFYQLYNSNCFKLNKINLSDYIPKYICRKNV
jgi:hypothetical protein